LKFILSRFLLVEFIVELLPLEFRNDDILESGNLREECRFSHALADPGLEIGVLLGANHRQGVALTEINKLQTCLNNENIYYHKF
jgi:hypothetical protein